MHYVTQQCHCGMPTWKAISNSLNINLIHGHYGDAIMSVMASQIASLTIVYSTVYSGTDSKLTSKFCITGLCQGNQLVTGEFLEQRASDTDNLSIWWHHHDIFKAGCLSISTYQGSVKMWRHLTVSVHPTGADALVPHDIKPPSTTDLCWLQHDHTLPFSICCLTNIRLITSCPWGYAGKRAVSAFTELPALPIYQYRKAHENSDLNFAQTCLSIT